MAEMVEVNANLMGPAAVQGAFDEADVAAGTEHPIFGFRGTALALRDAHPLPVDGMSRNRFVDNAGSLAQDSRDEREINLRHGPRGKLTGERAMGRVVLRHYESAAGFLVQAMDDAGTFLSPDAGKILAVREKCVHQGMLLMPRARVHDDSRRLVQDEEVVVLEKNFERYLFRLRFDFFDRRLAQFHDVASANKIARPRRFSIQPNESFPDQRLEAGTRKGGQSQGQKTVEPLPGLFLFDRELDHG